MHHSEPLTTRFILRMNKSLNRHDSRERERIEHGADKLATNVERAPYFEFAYKIILTMAAILICPAIVISLHSAIAAPFEFNIIASFLYFLFGSIGRIATTFYNKELQSRIGIQSKLAEPSVRFTTKDLFAAMIIGGSLGICFAIALYGCGIFLHYAPRVP